MSFFKVRTYQIVGVLLAFAVMLTLLVPAVAADGHTFDVSVYHGINGKSLGLSKDLPVNVYINGALAIPNLKFKDKIETELPGGEEYTITVESVELGQQLPSMTVGPVTIPAGVDVSIHAKLSDGKTPILKVMVK